MGYLQKDAVRTMILSYIGMVVGYVNKGLLFLILFSTEEIGVLNLLFSVGILIAQFSNLGTLYSIWRFFPFFRNQDKGHYGFLLMNVILVLIGVTLITLGIVLFRDSVVYFYSDKSKLFVDYYYLILPIGISTVYFLLFENYLRGLMKNILPVFANELLLRLVLLSLLGAYWLKWIDFNQFIYLYAITHVIPALILLIYLMITKELTFSIRSISVPKKFRRILISFSLYNYINSLGALLVVSVDMLMLASMKGLEVTGVYSMIIFLISAIQIPYRSLLRTTSPIVSVYWKERKMKEMNSLYKKVSSISLIIALVLFTLVWINRNALFSFLPAEFTPGIWVFFFLMMGRIIDMYYGLNGVILITSKKYKYDLYFSIGLIGLTVILNYLLIPIYGMVGAAIATAITFIIYNTARTILVYKIYGLQPLEFKQLLVVIITIFIVLFFEWIFPSIDNRYLSVVVRTASYMTLFGLLLFKLKLNEDIISYIKAFIEASKKKIFKITE